MRLQELVLKNYRGYNQAVVIPLDGRVLLFFGQNGRGKSSVFGALEMALFPAEKIAELRGEFGSRAPLTNRFNPSSVGTINLHVLGEDNRKETITQEVRDQLDEMQPAALPLHREIAGHRRRIFFTQDLLRDLMLGSQEIRYRRLSEMLGCDAYDHLVEALRNWAEMRGLKVREQSITLDRLDDLMDGIASLLRERDMESIHNGLVQRRFDPDAENWFIRAVLRYVEEKNVALFGFLHEHTQIEQVPTRGVLVAWSRTLADVRQHLVRLSDRELVPSTSNLLQVPLPESWFEVLHELLQRRIEARSRLTDVKNTIITRRNAYGDHLSKRQVVNALAELSHHLRAAELDCEAADHAWIVSVDHFRKCADAAFGQAEAGEYVLPRLEFIRRRVREMGTQMPTTVKHVRTLVKHRHAVLHRVRYLYDALISLTHSELVRRSKLLLPLWKQYYGQITSHAHFQDVNIDVQQQAVVEDAMTGIWSPPSRRRTVRFLVSDPEDKKKSDDSLPMQALLSEGQMNCAVVALALALSEVNPPPLKVIALDDPFVSWDDVNMENFLAAVRGLAAKRWTIILSTCDSRVVSSFRKNMETLGEDFSSTTYTFHDWDKERGPRISIDRLPLRQTRHLRDLPPEVIERELL